MKLFWGDFWRQKTPFIQKAPQFLLLAIFEPSMATKEIFQHLFPTKRRHVLWRNDWFPLMWFPCFPHPAKTQFSFMTLSLKPWSMISLLDGGHTWKSSWEQTASCQNPLPQSGKLLSPIFAWKFSTLRLAPAISNCDQDKSCPLMSLMMKNWGPSIASWRHWKFTMP